MADMTKSIKDCTDKELDALILRLRKEAEAQGLVQDMKRRSTPPVPYDPYNESNNVRDFSVSTEAPVSSLYHYGVLGMKWRHKKPKSTLQKIADDYNKSTSLDLMTAINDRIRSHNAKRFEMAKIRKQLEEGAKTLSEAEKKRLSDILINYAQEGKAIQRDRDEILKKNGKDYALQTYHSATDEEIDDFLQHFGILGMKWGIRRQRGSDGRVVEGSRGSDDHQKARDLKKKGARNLSNAELKAYVERMNLEKQYSNLNKKEVSAGRKFVSDVLMTAGKTTLTNFVTKQMTTQLEKAVTKN